MILQGDMERVVKEVNRVISGLVERIEALEAKQAKEKPTTARSKSVKKE